MEMPPRSPPQTKVVKALRPVIVLIAWSGAATEITRASKTSGIAAKPKPSSSRLGAMR